MLCKEKSGFVSGNSLLKELWESILSLKFFLMETCFWSFSIRGPQLQSRLYCSFMFLWHPTISHVACPGQLSVALVQSSILHAFKIRILSSSDGCLKREGIMDRYGMGLPPPNKLLPGIMLPLLKF